jgi:hypothetical protein
VKRALLDGAYGQPVVPRKGYVEVKSKVKVLANALSILGTQSVRNAPR